MPGPAPVVAQRDEPNVGDSVRLDFGWISGWTYGRLIAIENDSVKLRQFPSDASFPLAKVREFQVWRKRDAALEFGLSIPIGILAGVAMNKLSSTRITGSDGGDIAVYTGLDMAVTTLFLLIQPGKWKTYEIR